MGRQHPTIHHVGAAADRLAARQVAIDQVHAEAAARAAEAATHPADRPAEQKGATGVQADPGR